MPGKNCQGYHFYLKINPAIFKSISICILGHWTTWNIFVFKNTKPLYSLLSFVVRYTQTHAHTDARLQTYKWGTFSILPCAAHLKCFKLYFTLNIQLITLNCNSLQHSLLDVHYFRNSSNHEVNICNPFQIWHHLFFCLLVLFCFFLLSAVHQPWQFCLFFLPGLILNSEPSSEPLAFIFTGSSYV